MNALSPYENVYQKSVNVHCGQVFRNDVGIFTYNCFFCKLSFRSAQHLEHHVVDHFLDIKVEECNADDAIDKEFIDNNDVIAVDDLVVDESDAVESDAIESEANESEADESETEQDDAANHEIEVQEATANVEANSSQASEQTQPEIENADIVQIVAVVAVQDIVHYSFAVHPNDWNVTCACCDVKYACQGLRDQHVHQKVPSFSKCPLCPAYFTERMGRLYHKVLHQLPESKQFKCIHCTRVFDSKSALTAHTFENQPAIQLPTSLKPILGHAKQVKLQLPSFECDICGKKYGVKTCLEKHLQDHVSFKLDCAICQKRFKVADQLRKHMRVHNGIKYPCTECDKVYNHLENLRIHRWTHTGKKSYVCHLCGKSYITSTTLKQHLKEFHERNKDHGCAYCNDSFYTKTLLKDHLRAKHTFDRPFVCAQCGKSFTSSRYLSAHKKLHSGKQYPCRYCERTFNHVTNRYIHEKRKHLHFID